MLERLFGGSGPLPREALSNDNQSAVSAAAIGAPPPGGWPPPIDGTGARLLTIVDDLGPGVPRTLVNYDPFTTPLARSQLLMSPTYNIPLGNLTVKSCRAGVLFRVNTV
jgi:hypothetical protein